MDLKELLETPPWDWPRDTAKRLQRVLSDAAASAADRLVAAELAGDLTVINDELANALATIIGNSKEPEALRAEAALALGPVLEQADTHGDEEPEYVPVTPVTIRKVQSLLKDLHADENEPTEIRRRVLEASVRSPQSWHKKAIREAYASPERDWKLTAVFAMRWVRGFDNAILEALKSGDEEIQCEAVAAAGNWEIGAAWRHIAAILQAPEPPKSLLLAAIEASINVRPTEAGELLGELTDSDDVEIAEAAEEALMMVEPAFDDEEEDDEGEHPPRGPWIN